MDSFADIDLSTYFWNSRRWPYLKEFLLVREAETLIIPLIKKNDNIMGRQALDGAPMNLQAIADMRNPPRSRERCR